MFAGADATDGAAVFLGNGRSGILSTISKIRDVLSSILRSAVDVEYLNKNPLEGLRLPLDKRPKRPKPTITPGQFAHLTRLVSEPYATMIFVAVWTGLSSERIDWPEVALYSHRLHHDRRTLLPWRLVGPKTDASAATIGVGPEVIARLLPSDNSHRRGARWARGPKAQAGQIRGARRSSFSERARRPSDERPEHPQATPAAGGPKARLTVRQLAVSQNFSCNLANPGRRRSEIGSRANAPFAHFNNDGYLRSDRAGVTTPSSGTAVSICRRRARSRWTATHGSGS